MSGIDIEAINFLLDSIERDEAGLVIFDQPGVNRGAVSTLLDFHVPALLRALSSPRVEEVRREALDALELIEVDLEAGDVPAKFRVKRALSRTKAWLAKFRALSPPVG